MAIGKRWAVAFVRSCHSGRVVCEGWHGLNICWLLELLKYSNQNRTPEIEWNIIGKPLTKQICKTCSLYWSASVSRKKGIAEFIWFNHRNVDMNLVWFICYFLPFKPDNGQSHKKYPFRWKHTFYHRTFMDFSSMYYHIGHFSLWASRPRGLVHTQKCLFLGCINMTFSCQCQCPKHWPFLVPWHPKITVVVHPYHSW